MNNNAAILRSLIVYSICIPFAIWMGYLLAAESPLYERSNWIIWGLLALLLSAPIFLRWHHLLLIASWNFGMSLFFLPGTPQIWMPMVCLSLTISILQRTLNSRAHFISAPQITRPLLCLTAVALITAKLTGGIGLHSLGSDVMGGKKYIMLFMGILGYFALIARRIPSNQAGLAVMLFFLAYCTSAISDLVSVAPASLNFLSLLFGSNYYALSEGSTNMLRLGGVCIAATGLFSLMLARYGMRGIFFSGKLWRPIALALFLILALFGGFRSKLLSCAMIFSIQFYLERMHRTKLFPMLMMCGIMVAVLCVPFANKLPNTFQRALAFLPLKLNSAARLDAEASSEWRARIAKSVLPEIPGHLLLGKGYALSQTDFQNMTEQGFQSTDAANWGSTIAGDYHNGPLSVIIPFGVWGVIAFLWFLIAGARALYSNYRYGDPALRNVNILLFAMFLTRGIIFCSPIFGSLFSDMAGFAGLLGLGISLNGGICRPAPKPVQQFHKVRPSTPARFQPAFPR